MSVNSSNIKPLLRHFLVQRFLTERLLRFADEEGIAELLASMQRFDMKKAVEAFQQKFGYKLRDRTRLRMVKVLLDLLNECEYLKCNDDFYLWDDTINLQIKLQKDEHEIINTLLKGQVIFFDECISYTGNFLRGAPSLYGFNNNSKYIWEEFLGNAEFSFARSVLIKLLFSGKGERCNVLDLCYGPGFDILQMQELSPDIRITALDFKSIFYNQASRRILNSNSVRWVESELWNGFGAPLPLEDNTFDCVFFACADPYIPEESREYVYKDIFRVLKPGGILGILTHSYPDAERKYVRDTWIRRGILCHDFFESVCEGWHGFYNAQESENIFKRIGYNIHSVMLNASVWRLDKP